MMQCQLNIIMPNGTMSNITKLYNVKCYDQKWLSMSNTTTKNIQTNDNPFNRSKLRPVSRGSARDKFLYVTREL